MGNIVSQIELYISIVAYTATDGFSLSLAFLC